MPNEYLTKEYEVCFEQMRYYDTRHSDLLKYVITLASTVVAALFALYQYFNVEQLDEKRIFDPTYWNLASILAGLVFFGTLLLYLGMVQNRVYFVRVASQVNSLRDYFLDLSAKDFTGNKLWRKSGPHMFSWSSLQSHQLALAALVPSVFLGIFVWCLAKADNESSKPTMRTIVATLTCFVVVWGLSALYLRWEGRRTVA